MWPIMMVFDTLHKLHFEVYFSLNDTLLQKVHEFCIIASCVNYHHDI
jgi:hypothetical protein